eukprot:scaffold4039_cov124-Isochrysis_galbana.AAC.5
MQRRACLENRPLLSRACGRFLLRGMFRTLSPLTRAALLGWRERCSMQSGARIRGHRLRLSLSM